MVNAPSSGEFARELEVARQLAREAGASILRHYDGRVSVEYKGEGTADPVTAADRDANQVIVRGLAAAFPDDGILAEETPPDPARHGKRRLWCVDPLDGTREFLDRNGQFAVMIGLAIDGEARLGVVYQPTEDAMYWGVAGDAWIERRGVTSRLRPTLTHDAKSAVIVASRSHRSEEVARLGSALGVTHEVPLGSVGLKMGRIAEGQADIYVSFSNRTHEWDACAPEAVLRAAGGLVSDCVGKPLRYNKPQTITPHGIAASNGALHPAVIAAAAPIARERLVID